MSLRLRPWQYRRCRHQSYPTAYADAATHLHPSSEVFRLVLAQLHLHTELITLLFEYFHQFIKLMLWLIRHLMLQLNFV